MNIEQLEKEIENRILDLGKLIDKQGEDENELFNRQLEAIEILGMINPAKSEKLYDKLGLDPM